MKKNLFYAVVAIGMLASCAENEYVGEVTPNPVANDNNAIVFSSGAKAHTRGDNDHVGADAASLLGGKFIVGGFKGEFKGDGTDGNGTMTQVFDNYLVQWGVNTAGTTQSNTSDWKYVGLTAPNPPSSIVGAQTIKYWDFSTAQYDFAAYSTGTSGIVTSANDLEAGKILVTPIAIANTYTGPTYSLAGSKDDLKECYISDMVTVYNADYKNEVQLTFRKLSSKIRVALYETIPGYSVKNVEFYTDHTTAITTDISNNTSAILFMPADPTDQGATLVPTDNFYTKGKYTITFPTIGSSKKNVTDYPDYNKAHISFEADAASGSTSKTQTFGTLQYVVKHDREDATSGDNATKAYLGITSKTASFAGTTEPYYVDVLPNETGAVLELRVNYTLVSTDGSGETIKVYGATAYVPAIYAQWKPGYAYTYIFKISDNTNGWTSTAGGDGKEGLYPITFDAIALETTDNTQSTITTVATPSITTYQKGHNYKTDGPEYTASTEAEKAIFVQVMKDGTLANDLATKGQLYTVTDRTNMEITEADVMDALNIQASATTSTPKAITGRNGWVLTEATSAANIVAVPGADGNDIEVTAGTAASFAATAGTYAYVYDATPTQNAPAASYIYSAVKFTAGASQPDDWSGNYWDNPNGTGDAVTTFSSTEAVTYYRRYTNNNKVYGVKVIKVQ